MSLKYKGGIQENVYSAELNNIAYANTNGVLTGCEVTESVTPAMSVDVASGNVFFGNDTIEVSASNDLAISSNSSGFSRLDLVVVNSSGVISVITGTAAQVVTTPDYEPDDYVVLARVTVTSGATSITNTMVKDIRVLNIGGSGGGSGGGTFGRHTQEFTSQTSVTVTHNLGDDEPIIQVYNNSSELIPYSDYTVTIVNINSLTVTFSTSTSGKLVVHGGSGLNNGLYTTSLTSQTSTTITHNLENKYVNVVCYDDSDEMVFPQSVVIIDEDSFTITFNSSFTGNVMVSGGVSSSGVAGVNTMGVVVHGADDTVARPTGYGAVTWIGSVEPTNMEENDLWIDNS
jgi:hypothetical protein